MKYFISTYSNLLPILRKTRFQICIHQSLYFKRPEKSTCYIPERGNGFHCERKRNEQPVLVSFISTVPLIKTSKSE